MKLDSIMRSQLLGSYVGVEMPVGKKYKDIKASMYHVELGET